MRGLTIAYGLPDWSQSDTTLDTSDTSASERFMHSKIDQVWLGSSPQTCLPGVAGSAVSAARISSISSTSGLYEGKRIETGAGGR